MFAIANQYLNLMVQTIKRSPFATVNADGKKSYGDAELHKAHVVERPTLARDTQGNERLADAIAWVFGAAGFDPQDKVEMPDGTTPRIFSVERHYDERGKVHHEKLLLVRRRGR